MSGGKVLVLGDDTRSFLATVRSLGRQGIEVHVAPGDLRAAALRSRYISCIHKLPPYLGDGEEWVAAVSALLGRERFDLVIPCEDKSLLPFHAHRDVLGKLSRIAIPDPVSIETLFDKARTKELATSLGINIARTLAPADCQQPEEAFRTLGAPVVVKPKNSYRLGTLHRRAVVQIIDTPEKLAKSTAGLDRNSYYLEQFFPGRGVGLSILADQGTILLAFQHHRVHEGPGGGASPYRVSAPIAPELIDACTKIIAHLAYTGVAMFEFRRNFDTGAWILLEVNARPWGSLPLPIAVGVDFPYAWYRLLVHGERLTKSNYRYGVYGRNPVLDFYFLLAALADARGLKGRLRSFAGWVASFRHLMGGRERLDTIVADDPRPGIAEISGLLASYGRRATRRFTRAIPGVLALQRAAARASLRRRLRQAIKRDGRLSLVFVCFGNICRSSFAEHSLTKILGEYKEHVQVASAGTYPIVGRASPPEAITAARRFDVDLSNHRSGYITDSLIDDASMVFVFDHTNVDGVRARFPSKSCPILLLGLLGTGSTARREIADPFGGTPDEFEHTYRQIEDAVTTIRKSIADLLGPPPLTMQTVDSTKSAVQLSFSLRPTSAFPNLAETWCDLESRSDASFFLTWDWIGCWLAETGRPSLVLVAEISGKVVTLGLLTLVTYHRHRLLHAKALVLNQAGDPNLDIVTIEYNGFLVDREFVESASLGCLEFLQSPEATRVLGQNWDEIHFGGVPDTFEPLAEATGLSVWLRYRSPSWKVDLTTIRRSGRPYLSHLSSNTRYQIKRAIRLYEERGPLTARRATTLDEAMRFYQEMQELHQRYWTGRGALGSFAFPFYERFHRSLIANCITRGTAELVRVAAGDSVIGYVYNFIYRGWVCAYQTGLAYDPDPRLKPGLVSHYLCIEQHLAEDAHSYDFLAGKSRYKSSLGTPGTDILNVVLQRPAAKLRIESALRQIKSSLRYISS